MVEDINHTVYNNNEEERKGEEMLFSHSPGFKASLFCIVSQDWKTTRVQYPFGMKCVARFGWALTLVVCIVFFFVLFFLVQFFLKV